MKTIRVVLAFSVLVTSLSVPPQTMAQEATGDVSGVWYSRIRVSHPQSLWYPTELPFTEYGQSVWDNTRPGKGPRQDLPANGNDPVGNANPQGLYRSIIYFKPWEFIQLEDRVIQLFELGRNWRNIWTDGRPVAGELDTGPYWYGYSVGHWEGDTLVVTTNNLDGRAWMDDWGTRMSEYDTVVTERWRRTSETTMELEITVDAPELYTEAWTSKPLVLTLQTEGPNAEPLETIYSPMDENLFNDLIRDPVAGKGD